MSPAGPGAPVRRAVLLAAGRGRRLVPHTDTCPKPLLAWRGRPTLDHLCDGLVAAGIEEAVLVTHHLAHLVDGWAAARTARDVAPRLVAVRQSRLAGTADALEAVADARPGFLSEPFVLAATDYLVGPAFFADLLRFHAAHGAPASASLKRLEPGEAVARSSVRFDAADPTRVREVVEKPAPGTAPSDVGANLVFVLPPEIVPRVRAVGPSPRGEREVQAALNAWLADGGDCRGLLAPTPAEWVPGTA